MLAPPNSNTWATPRSSFATTGGTESLRPISLPCPTVNRRLAQELGTAIDIEARRPILGNRQGGSLRAGHQAHRAPQGSSVRGQAPPWPALGTLPHRPCWVKQGKAWLRQRPSTVPVGFCPLIFNLARHRSESIALPLISATEQYSVEVSKARIFTNNWMKSRHLAGC